MILFWDNIGITPFVIPFFFVNDNMNKKLNIYDYINRKYNKLTILREYKKENNNSTYVLCQCDCGNTTIQSLSTVINNKVKSCGCLRTYKYENEIINKRLYKIWQHVKSRCYCKTDPKYKNYGARNITICDDWKDDFLVFQKWAINNGYNDSLTIERIDVNGNYTPDNCKFISFSEQTKNKTCSHYYKVNNKIYSLKELAEYLNVSYKKLHKDLVISHKEFYYKDNKLVVILPSNYLDYINQK